MRTSTLPVMERPREKLLNQGVSALSDAEKRMIVWGNARRLFGLEGDA